MGMGVHPSGWLKAAPQAGNGRVGAMMVSIDKAGRVVIPKSIRDRLDLGPGSRLEIEAHGDTIRISRSQRVSRRLAFTDDGRPFFPAADESPRTDLDVQRLRDTLTR